MEESQRVRQREVMQLHPAKQRVAAAEDGTVRSGDDRAAGERAFHDLAIGGYRGFVRLGTDEVGLAHDGAQVAIVDGFRTVDVRRRTALARDDATERDRVVDLALLSMPERVHGFLVADSLFVRQERRRGSHEDRLLRRAERRQGPDQIIDSASRFGEGSRGPGEPRWLESVGIP